MDWPILESGVNLRAQIVPMISFRTQFGCQKQGD